MMWTAGIAILREVLGKTRFNSVSNEDREDWKVQNVNDWIKRRNH